MWTCDRQCASRHATGEALVGPYRWGVYDLLVMPPCFPWGGASASAALVVRRLSLAGRASAIAALVVRVCVRAALVVRRISLRWSCVCVRDAVWLAPGMENVCLTFVTPCLLAGDKSLTDVIAHEIAHSWTGESRVWRSGTAHACR